MKLAWAFLLRLLDNASSVLEGCFIFCECFVGAIIAGIAYATKEISASWSVPLTHTYPDCLEDEGK